MTEYLASLTLPELVPILSIFAGMLVGFYGIAKLMLKQATKEREADRQERKRFSDAIEKMAESSEKVADTNKEIANAVIKQADESEKRNGHIVELIIESRDKIIKSTTHVHKQQIDESIIKKQVTK